METSNARKDFFEFFGQGFSEIRDGNGELFFHNFLILFLFALALHTLPG